jgi:hypothetical protein
VHRQKKRSQLKPGFRQIRPVLVKIERESTKMEVACLAVVNNVASPEIITGARLADGADVDNITVILVQMPVGLRVNMNTTSGVAIEHGGQMRVPDKRHKLVANLKVEGGLLGFPNVPESPRTLDLGVDE